MGDHSAWAVAAAILIVEAKYNNNVAEIIQLEEDVYGTGLSKIREYDGLTPASTLGSEIRKTGFFFSVGKGLYSVDEVEAVKKEKVINALNDYLKWLEERYPSGYSLYFAKRDAKVLEGLLPQIDQLKSQVVSLEKNCRLDSDALWHYRATKNKRMLRNVNEELAELNYWVDKLR